jgi:hypothetical protein
MAVRISVDTDTWWHLRAGQWMVEHRQLLRSDPFSYTRSGAAWEYPGWLVEIPMFGIFQAFGPGGLNLWTAAMVTLTFAFVWRTLSGGPFLRAFASIFAAVASAVYWSARPYLVTFLFTAVFIWMLEEYRKRSVGMEVRKIWLLPLLMVIWVNSHGGFITGFIVWGVYLTNELVGWLIKKIRRTEVGIEATRKGVVQLSVLGLLLLAAVCLNPFGPVMLAYPLKTVTIGALQDYIQEWQSPNFHVLSVQPFAWLLLATIGALGVSRRRILLTDFLLTAGFAFMGLMAGRNIALFALPAPMTLTRHVEPLLEAAGKTLGYQPQITKSRPLQNVLNWGLLVLLSIAVLVKIGLVVPEVENDKAFRKSLPVDAVAFIKHAQYPGRIFNSYDWGGYLLWALPEYPVFVDGRTDLYDDAVIDQWLNVVRGEDGWQKILSDNNVHLILIEKKATITLMLDETADWRKVFEDDLAAVYRFCPETQKQDCSP